MQKRTWGVAVIVLVLAALGGAAAYAYSHSTGKKLTELIPAPEATSVPAVADTTPTQTGMPRCAGILKLTATTTVSVAWHTPTRMNDLGLHRNDACEPTENNPFDPESTAPDRFVYLPSGTTLDTGEQNVYGLSDIGALDYYNVGFVSGGSYDGGTVVLAVAEDGSNGWIEDNGMQVMRFILKDGKLTLIAKDSGLGVYGLVPEKFSIDPGSVFKGLPLPNSFTYKGATFKRPDYGLSVDYHFPLAKVAAGTELKDMVVAFAHPTLGSVYTDRAGNDNDYFSDDGGVGFSGIRSGLYVKAPDGTYADYQEVFPFWYNTDTHLASITWNDGTKADKEYLPTDYGGCGSTNYASVIGGLAKSDITPAGKTANGDIVYTLANSETPLLRKLYTQFENYRAVIASWPADEIPADMSFTEFAASKQIFFWYDPLGRLIKFQTSRYSAAECGKPVIYLYPTQTTDIAVTVAPTGGMTVSIPTYGNGWHVRATPESVITNLADGETYPYLFWEGRSKDIYDMPPKGWVVAKADVHSFLTGKLAELGLNAQETADFEEFWEPRMATAPYYFISFEDTAAMNRIAPLTVTPTPDTVIRVLMDFKPLSAPISVENYRIRTPERKGFTVLEWGGVLR